MIATLIIVFNFSLQSQSMPLKALIIDDEDLSRMLIDTALKKAGYETTLLKDGQDAEEAIREDTYDLVVTDLLMPGKEGVDVIDDLKQNHPQIKVIAVSAGGVVGHSSYLKLAQAYGADAVLEKPFTAAQLISTVSDVLS